MNAVFCCINRLLYRNWCSMNRQWDSLKSLIFISLSFFGKCSSCNSACLLGVILFSKAYTNFLFHGELLGQRIFDFRTLGQAHLHCYLTKRASLWSFGGRPGEKHNHYILSRLTLRFGKLRCMISVCVNCCW